MNKDTIFRQDAIDAAVKSADPYYKDGIAEELMNLPPAPSEHKKGKWIDNGLDGIGAMGIEYRWQKCSCCGYEISKAPMQRFPKFCSGCGADMRGGQNESD